MKLIISLGIIVYVFYRKIDIDKLSGVFQDLPFKVLLLCVFLYSITIFFKALRWKILLLLRHTEISYFNLLRIYYTGEFFNRILPASGGDGVRAFLTKNTGLTLNDIVISISVERTVDFLLQFIFAGFGIYIISSHYDPVSLIRSAVFIAVILSSGLVAAYYLKRLSLASGVYHLIAKFLNGFFETLDIFLKNRKSFFMNLILGVINRLLIIFGVFLIGSELGIVLPFSVYLSIVSIAQLLILFPVSFGGWGIRESSFIYFFSLYDISSEQSMALSVIQGFLLLVITSPGLLFWIYIKKNKS